MKFNTALLTKTAFTGLLGLLLAVPVQAVPVLQLYVEGAEYDFDHESWVFELQPDQENTIRLWAIGNTSNGPGAGGGIMNVKLSAVYENQVDGDDLDPFTLTSSQTGDLVFTDPSKADDAQWIQTNDSGDTPEMSDGKTLSGHGTYGDGWEWQEFLLGDFTLSDSPIADFFDVFPDAGVAYGQINVYEITIDAAITDIHFDLYDSVEAKNGAKGVFAPFSHDAGTGTNEPMPPIPEPPVIMLFGLGLILTGLIRRKNTTS
jgi:hypothetical protein